MRVCVRRQNQYTDVRLGRGEVFRTNTYGGAPWTGSENDGKTFQTQRTLYVQFGAGAEQFLRRRWRVTPKRYFRITRPRAVTSCTRGGLHDCRFPYVSYQRASPVPIVRRNCRRKNYRAPSAGKNSRVSYAALEPNNKRVHGASCRFRNVLAACRCQNQK